MALLYIDSFDHYVTADITAKWTNKGVSDVTPTISAGNGRHSSSSLRLAAAGPLNNSTAWVQKVLTPADATMICGFAVSVPSAAIGSTGLPLAAVRDGSTTQVCLRINNTGTLSVVRGNQGGTVLGTTTAVVPFSTFTFIEWKVLIDPSVGTVDVRINGASALSLTGQNTRSSGTSQWTAFNLGVIDAVFNTYGTTSNTDYDDLYVLDGSGSSPLNAFLGDARVDARYPTGAGATTGWTPSTGSNWQNVDDTAPDGDSTYNATSTVNAVDTFVTQDAPVAGALLYGVQLCLSQKKTDSGTCSLAPVVRHSSTNYAGTAFNPSTSYAVACTVYGTNPGTSAAWTETDFNNAEFGYKRTA